MHPDLERDEANPLTKVSTSFLLPRMCKGSATLHATLRKMGMVELDRGLHGPWGSTSLLNRPTTPRELPQNDPCGFDEGQEGIF